jgi:competence protein ComEA
VDDELDVLININQASKTLLMTLPGIGETTADAIILYIEENGYFDVIEDIMNVSGIGEATFEAIKDLITI